ncbi:hypothetical protein CQY20_16110, partial [Mycolicibacterium agri]
MYSHYPQHPTYGPYHNGYAPAPHPVQAPAQPSTANKGLLAVAGLAVAGAAAFGGVYLMNSTSAEPAASTAAAPSTVINLPSTIDIPSLTSSGDGPASVPVIVNNPAPVRVNGPAVNNPAPAPAP